MNQIHQAVHRFLEANRDQVIGLLELLVQADSINPDLAPTSKGEGLVQQHVVDWCRDHKLPVRSWEPDARRLDKYVGRPGYHPGKTFSGRPVVLCELEGRRSGPSLLFLNHADVVPAPEPEWEFPPFSGELSDGYVHGRGTVDMKGGLTSALVAAWCLKSLGILEAGRVIVASVPDEEAGGMGTLALLDEGVTADAAVVPEPTNLQVAPLCRGILWGEVQFFGRAGHIEMPQPAAASGGAVDALEYLYGFWSRIRQVNSEWARRPDKQHPYLPEPCQIRVAQLRGGEYPTTYADFASLTVDVQYLPSERDEQLCGGRVRSQVEGYLAGYVGEVSEKGDTWFGSHPPKMRWLVDADCAETPSDAPIVAAAVQCAQILGLDTALTGVPSHTDMGTLVAGGIPTVNFGPGMPSLAHQVNERVGVDHLLKCAEMFAVLGKLWTDRTC